MYKVKIVRNATELDNTIVLGGFYMSQNLKEKVLRNTSMKGMRRGREGEKRGSWGVGSQDMGCLRADGGHRLPGWSGEARAWKAAGTRPNSGGQEGAVRRALHWMHLTPLVQRGPGEGAGAPGGLQGQQRKEHGRAPPLPAEPPRTLQASRNRSRRAPAETPAELAARGTHARRWTCSPAGPAQGHTVLATDTTGQEGTQRLFLCPHTEMKGCQIHINSLIFWYRYFMSRTICLQAFKPVMNPCASL